MTAAAIAPGGFPVHNGGSKARALRNFLLEPDSPPTPSPQTVARETLEVIKGEVVELYRLHAAGLYRYAVALAHDADAARDAVQETFLRYYQARVEGTAIQTEAAWLFRVLRNFVLDQHRGAAARETVGLEGLHDRTDEKQDVEAEAGHREVAAQALRLLSPRELECLRLRTQGLRYGEIAAILEIEVGTVGALLARGLRKLREAVGNRSGVSGRTSPAPGL